MSKLIIPIDVSQLSDKERVGQQVKLAVRQGGKVTSQIVPLVEGKAQVELDVDPKQNLAIAVGPSHAPDEDIFNLQTLTAQVGPHRWRGQRTLTLSPFIVTPWWWWRWLRWCREFVIEGRVVCPDGVSPVAGAEVRAYDVDFFWWWSSVVPVGNVAYTDGSGNFKIKFRWCCGWWPWWWWRLRYWRLDPLLVRRIKPVLELHPELKFRDPTPEPRADIVDLRAQAISRLDLGQPAFASRAAAESPSPLPAGLVATRKIADPTVLSSLRPHLLRVLPHIPELERLRIWPWWPWTPWTDCTPDIIFRVTQNCGGDEPKVIVDENIFDTRFNVPTDLNVTLVANEEACCLPPGDDEPEGDCAYISSVCGVGVDDIGGNVLTPGPVGYADPNGWDRPFSEVVNFHGQFGTSAQADFYELERARHATGLWEPVPPGALLGFSRKYFDSTLPFGSQYVHPAFPVLNFGTLNVYESRRHYEDTHPPANWGNPMTGRAWEADNLNLHARVQTSGFFNDEVYDFRLIGYTALPSGEPDPASRKVLEGCGQDDRNNLAVIRIDNRTVADPTPGNVHINTTEPDCGILDVRLGGTTVSPCGAENIDPAGPPTPLDIDFFVTDPDGHLEEYTLVVKYDLGAITDLLNLPAGTSTLTAIAGGPEGPSYPEAVAQGAVRPTWGGGTMRLHVNNALTVFPKTCCYLVELVVTKRNIISCHAHPYYNVTHYSFTITVGP